MERCLADSVHGNQAIVKTFCSLDFINFIVKLNYGRTNGFELDKERCWQRR